MVAHVDDDGCIISGEDIFDTHTHTADPLQTNMHIGCMIVAEYDTCKITGAYAHLNCITSTVGIIGNRHSMEVTHSYKERIFNLFPPQLKTDLRMI